ncbi:hypothetical protein ACIA8K_34190 [Catenuloplanes sp. NPDC051500]|uniref:hypothetical protein n=1 Tax=Catenuloplanes sp. NPDC051500 TaxID=3363959 RepID=UPI0037ADFD94
MATPALASPGTGTPSARQYEAVGLGSYQGDFLEPAALNNHRDIVGRVGGQPFLWRSGEVETLAVLTMGSTGEALDISDSGHIVGASTTDGVQHAVYWKADGSVWELPGLGGPFSVARQVNERGVILGEAMDADGNWHYVRWDDRVVTDLGAFSGDVSTSGINGAGQMVGTAPFGSSRHAARWEADGTLNDLGVVAGTTMSWGNAINDHGVVVGEASNGGMGDVTVAFSADGAESSVLPVADGYSATALKINNAGLIIGQTFGGLAESNPTMWVDSVQVDPKSVGVGTPLIKDLNDNGDLIGGFGGMQTGEAYLYV